MAVEPPLSIGSSHSAPVQLAPVSAAAKVRLQGVEAGRGVAALLVVLYHAALHVEGDVPGSAPVLWGLPHFGHAGVDFFFVLSGFIISFVHRGDVGRPERLGHYLERRFTRVLPFYWLVLCFSLLDTWLLHRAQFPGVCEVISNVLLLPQAKDQIVGGAWTLVFELMFYLVFAIAICSRRIGAVVLCAWAALVAAGLFLNPSSESAALVVASSPFCIEFFLGIGAAGLLSRRTVPFSGVLLTIGLTGFALAGLCEVAGRLYGFGATARLAYGTCSLMVILALVERERSGRLKVPRFMALLGRASYSVYLVHLIAIGITFKFLSMALQLTPSWSFPVWAFLCAMGLAAGILASVWVEQPVIRYVRTRVFGARTKAASQGDGQPGNG
jgi:exopolysaccharide production protein ExoZ